MIHNKKFCITFAGAVGSSKTPISNFLSTKINLPVFNNDAIRTEVIEDLGMFSSDEYTKRRNVRLKDILESGISFICDASIDREWKEFKKFLTAEDYHYFIISLDLSKDLLTQLYETKKYYESLERIDKLMNDHNLFLSENADDIGLHILDHNFKNRCQISYDKTVEWQSKLLKDSLVEK